MNSEIAEVNKFDSCVKQALNKELKYQIRSMKNRQKHFVNISELSKIDEAKLFYTDIYPSDIFSEKLTTRLFDAVIHDELLYEALLSIKPNIRELLILKYWGDLSDSEVGQAMSMSQQVVNYNKNKALRNLKKIIEEMRKL
ncbi:MAG: hypothetical protein SOZ34_12040 [Clostridia bacterium]|nr:hypothetical protein [Clostridia bacterium]